MKKRVFYLHGKLCGKEKELRLLLMPFVVFYYGQSHKILRLMQVLHLMFGKKLGKDSGTWTELPTCKGQAGGCGTPLAIHSAELVFFLQEYQHGDTVECKCPNFYILKGSPTIICLRGQWTSPPVCLVFCTASEEDNGQKQY